MPNIVRTGPGALAKVASGGGSNFGVPGSWMQSAYGSGWPVAPVSAPRDVELPRTIDYPMSINSTLTPRTGYGLMPFSALLECYENVTELKIPVSLIHRELTSFIPRLIDSDGNEVEDHDYRWMCEAPDRRTPFNVWLTRFIKSAKIYDAPAVYLNKGNNGSIDALHYIDGSTLFLIVDQFGNTPKAEPVMDYMSRMVTESTGPQSPALPVSGAKSSISTIREYITSYAARQRENLSVPDKIPAYAQVIKGTPFSWWSEDQIWYMPQSRRVNAPYGESFIEQAWPWIMIIVNLTAFELGHYRTGNMPEGFITLPRDQFQTPDQIMVAEMMYNARMTSNPVTERNRLRMFPEGSEFKPTKKPDFPEGLYKRAWNNINHSIGVPPSEYGDIPGGGLGGKGFKEGAASDLSRNTLNPHRVFISGLFNYVLEQDGVDDVTFDLAYPMDEIDPDKKKANVYEGMAHGTLSLNDALGQLGLNPVEGSMEEVQGSGGTTRLRPVPSHIANQHLIVAGSTIYVIEDMQTQNGMAVPSFIQQPGGNAGGAPAGPETVIEQQGKEHTPEDFKTLQAALRQVMDTGKLDSKTISVPSGKTFAAPAKRVAKVDASHDDGAMIAVMIPAEAARQLRQITERLNLPDIAPIELAENMHVTLAYLPDFATVFNRRNEILACLTSLASSMPPLEGKIQGYGMFNGQDDTMRVLFALLDEPSLPFLRTAICNALDGIGLPYSKDYGFVPHITMAYIPKSCPLPEGFAVPNIPVNIGEITLAFGQDFTPIPLGSQAAIQKGDQRPGVPQDLMAAFVAQGAIESDILGIWRNTKTDELWVSCGDWAQSVTLTVIRAVCGSGVRIEAEASPPAIGEDYLGVEGDAPGQWELIKLAAANRLAKHCGVCPEDDDYFGAPISREVAFGFPDTNHANGVEIVAMCPDGLTPKAALWKPEGGEIEGLQSWIGGPQYLREEAAYLIDRSLGFMLVPVAYITEADDEAGAAIYYTRNMPAPQEPNRYAPEWMERAGVLDYVICQQDRGFKHNYGTHPDESGRMILFDNGLCLPAGGEGYCSSPFYELMLAKPLSESTLAALTLCLGDASTWRDVTDLVGAPAVQQARARIQQLLDQKIFVTVESGAAPATRGSGGL